MAPPNKTTKSPTPGPSTAAPLAIAPVRSLVGDALYAWALENHRPGYVFSQEELLRAGIIPNSDVNLLLPAVEYLVKNSFFRLHDKAGGSIAWELIDPEVAKNYAKLSRDEQLVLQVIHSAKDSGVWTKTIAHKTNLQTQGVDKVCKSLHGRGFIKSMKSVSHAQRKMWIAAELVPSEEATGGSWFSEGVLDQGLLTHVSNVIEIYVSDQSWQDVTLATSEDSRPEQKRKRPMDGFEEDGDDRSKLAKTVDGQNKVKAIKHQSPTKSYAPFEPGHKSYPVLSDITRRVGDMKVTATPLPQSAIAQLLQVMIYDNRLFILPRLARPTENPDDVLSNTINMYRSFIKPHEITERRRMQTRQMSTDVKVRAAAYRHQEIEDLGLGGSSEVPCMKCPVFDICGDGGPVNAVTCKYYPEWYDKIAEADKEQEANKKKFKERDKEKVDKGKGKERELSVGRARGPEMEIELEELEPS